MRFQSAQRTLVGLFIDFDVLSNSISGHVDGGRRLVQFPCPVHGFLVSDLELGRLP